MRGGRLIGSGCSREVWFAAQMFVVIDGIEKEESDTLLGITMAGLGEPVMHRMAGGEKNWALCEPR